MKTLTQAPTAQVGDRITVVCGNTFDTDGARVVEARVVGEVEVEFIGREIMCANADGFMYGVRELSEHPGFHYCTSGFPWVVKRWHRNIAQRAGVDISKVKEWAEGNYVGFNFVKDIKTEAELDRLILMLHNFNNPNPIEETGGVDYDMGE